MIKSATKPLSTVAPLLAVDVFVSTPAQVGCHTARLGRCRFHFRGAVYWHICSGDSWCHTFPTGRLGCALCTARQPIPRTV